MSASLYMPSFATWSEYLCDDDVDHDDDDDDDEDEDEDCGSSGLSSRSSTTSPVVAT